MGALARNPSVLYEQLDDRALLIDAEGTELMTLNLVGTLVWEALDGHRDADVIAAELASRFPQVPPERIEADVRAFLGELRREDLVVDGAPGPAADL